MEDKLVTLVILPFSNAQILKSQLEAKGIQCDLENIDLIEGSQSYSTQVKILENDVKRAFPVMNELLGTKPEFTTAESKKDDKKILVPVDFSKSSRKALKTAVLLAIAMNRKLTILHCYSNPVFQAIPSSDGFVYDSSLMMALGKDDKEVHRKFEEFVTETAEKVGKVNWELVEKEIIIKPGYAEDDILNYAKKSNPLLIVMGTKGDDSPATTVGSITADIIYNAKVPVLAIPEDIPALMDFRQLNKVLYATNFDEKDFVVLDKLINILKPFNSRVICAHVSQPDSGGWDLARLEGMKEILQKKYKKNQFDCKLLVGKNIQEALEKIIDEKQIDVLALTTHKRNMISRLFNPSLARKMTYHSKTPLLVFHA